MWLDARDGVAASQLDGYLFRAAQSGPVPAEVLLHGGGGLNSTISYKIMSRETGWARRINEAGYAVLMVDSFAPLIGDNDVWTRVGPCRELTDRAVSRGAIFDYQLYAGAYHSFD